VQQRSEPPPPAVAEPSRRRPPRTRLADPVPIPEAATKRPGPARVQEVLAAHQEAIEERLDEGLRRIRDAVAEGVRAAMEEAGPGALDPGEVSRALLSHAEERFQAVGLRLQRIEEVLRAMATRPQGNPTGPRPGDEIERLGTLVRELGRQQGEAMARLARAHRAAIGRLAQDQRTAIEDLGRRTGQGVVAVARALQHELEVELDDVRTSIRSMHRTLAWEGMSRSRPEPESPPDGTSTA
jgi:hypothetical protein